MSLEGCARESDPDNAGSCQEPEKARWLPFSEKGEQDPVQFF